MTFAFFSPGGAKKLLIVDKEIHELLCNQNIALECQKCTFQIDLNILLKSLQ